VAAEQVEDEHYILECRKKGLGGREGGHQGGGRAEIVNDRHDAVVADRVYHKARDHTDLWWGGVSNRRNKGGIDEGGRHWR